jgi:hypothetical protein
MFRFLPAVISRLLAAVVGGYALTGGILAVLGLPRAEAVVLASMLGIPVYLILLLWAFSQPALMGLWFKLVGATLVIWTLLLFVR